MSDYAIGKRMIEDAEFKAILDAYLQITGRALTEDTDSFPQVEGSPDFVLGLDGTATGFEISEVRNASDASDYFENASSKAWEKHDSYARRGVFQNPIILAFYSHAPALFDIAKELARLDAHGEFEGIGFKRFGQRICPRLLQRT